MYTIPFYTMPQSQPIPPPFSHPRPDWPYYGYRPGTVPQLTYTYPQQIYAAAIPFYAVAAPVFVPQIPFRPVIGYQTSNPTPLPVPAGTPSDVRYEMVGGVLRPVTHYQFNSPPGAGRGFNPGVGFGS